MCSSDLAAAIAAQPGRRTILTDAANFPTDRYILQGLARAHDLRLVVIDNEDPARADGERIDPAWLDSQMSEDVALVCLQVVQYRSGARQDVAAVNAVAARHGAIVLWDAAHAAGSIPLEFDANGVSLAVGCTYKYGNAGPGAPAWLYVSHAMQQRLQVPIQGWFAQRDQFAMGAHFERDASIRGFQIATPPVLGLRCVRVGFGMIGDAGIAAIGRKAAEGTDLMIALFDEWLEPLGFSLRTPRAAPERGAHETLAHLVMWEYESYAAYEAYKTRRKDYEGPYKEYKENDPYHKGVFVHNRMGYEFWKDVERDLWVE